MARAFYRDVVAPALHGMRHSAALLGNGSEVLGFDTPRSTDHGWGPRLQVFVDEDDVSPADALVDEALPESFRGWPTRFGWDDVPRASHVEVVELGEWLRAELGFDPTAGVTLRDWLSTPQQALLEVTRGDVFHDGLGRLEAVREALEWYPQEVWLWLLACQWRRIDQEEPFVGRTAEVGDELGSRVVAARLVREIMRLCFLLERRYAPYSKWLGSAFRQLDANAELGPPLHRALEATTYAEREAALVAAVEGVAARHNALGLTRRLDETVRPFYSRPFLVLGSGRFVEACLECVSDARLRSLPQIGAVDQFADSTDVLSYPPVFRRAPELYGRPLEP